MGYNIEPVLEADLSFLGEFIHSAKLALSINRLIFLDWPNEKVQSALYSRAVRSGHESPSAECFKAVDNSTQEIIGYIVLSRMSPNLKKQEDDSEEMEKETKGQVTSEGVNPPLFAEVNGAVGEIVNRVRDQDRFEITYMCVKPTAQRRGVGSKLVQLGFDRAKAEGIPLAVCAEAPSIPFFTAIGFKEMHHVDMNLRKYAPENSGFGLFRLAGMLWHP